MKFPPLLHGRELRKIPRGTRDTPMSRAKGTTASASIKSDITHRLSAQFAADALPAAPGGSVDGLWSPSDLLMRQDQWLGPVVCHISPSPSQRGVVEVVDCRNAVEL